VSKVWKWMCRHLVLTLVIVLILWFMGVGTWVKNLVAAVTAGTAVAEAVTGTATTEKKWNTGDTVATILTGGLWGLTKI